MVPVVMLHSSAPLTETLVPVDPTNAARAVCLRALPVLHVLLVCYQPQVFRVDALPVMAHVVNQQSFRDRANKEVVSEAVCPVSRLASARKHSVPVGAYRTLPFFASTYTRLVKAGHEFLHMFAGEIWNLWRPGHGVSLKCERPRREIVWAFLTLGATQGFYLKFVAR